MVALAKMPGRKERRYTCGLNKYRYRYMARCQYLNGILKLSICKTKEIRKGETEPKWDVYLSPRDKTYITRERQKDGTYKWRTAKVDNLEWEWEEAGADENYYINPEGKAAIKAILETKNSGVDGVIEWQKKVRTEKIEREEKRKTDRWDAAMKDVPENYPAGFEKFWKTEAFSDHYIFYKGADAKTGYCTGCGLTEKQLKSEMKKWTGRDAEVHEFDFGNKKLRMTTAQMMGLYELKNRDQAKEHIKYGGVITTTKAGTKVYRNSEGIRLTEYEVGKICEELTPEQKKVADSMQQFMQNRCSAWGNATTMQMYGYRRFGGQHYYPIKTSGNTVDTKDQTSYWGVKNQGFTKKTMKNARNAIVVDDIFDVFTKHVTDMASYGSYTAALSDAMKWFNYRQKAGLDDHMTEDEVLDILESKTSVKAQIERAYGKEYQEYFKKLVQDINAEG